MDRNILRENYLWIVQIDEDELKKYDCNPSQWGDMNCVTPADMHKLLDAGYDFEVSNSDMEGIWNTFIIKSPTGCVEVGAMTSRDGKPDVTFGRSWDTKSQIPAHVAENAIYEHLMPVINKNVFVTFPHNRTVTETSSVNRDPNKFVIYMWYSPTSGSIGSPSSIFGISGGHARDVSQFGIWDEGYPIMDGHVEVGAIDDNNLYIYHDVGHYRGADANKLFTRYMQEAAKVLKNGCTFDEDAMRKIYASYCMKRVEEERSTIASRILSMKQTAESHQRELIAALRDVQVMEVRQRSIENISSEEEERFSEEFDKLKDIHLVEKVMIRSPSLMVETGMIKVKDTRTDVVHDIGKFHININMDNSTLKIKNKSWTVDGSEGRGMNAPHVFGDGLPCLGNMSAVIPELVGRYDFSAAVMVIIQYLESVNLDDAAGVCLHYWPISKEEAEKHGIEGSQKHGFINVCSEDDFYTTYTQIQLDEIWSNLE